MDKRSKSAGKRGTAKAKRPTRRAPKPAPQPAPPIEKHRPTRGEVEQRVNSVVTMIATRSRYEEIVRYGATQWGINSRQTDKYIARANAIIRAEAYKDRAQRIAEHLAALDTLVKRAYAIDDLSSMRAAIAEKSKLCGDYPAQQVKVSAWQDEIVQLLKDGKLSIQDVVAEFGEQQGRQFAIAAGVGAVAAGSAEGEGTGQAGTGEQPTSPAADRLDAPVPGDADARPAA